RVDVPRRTSQPTRFRAVSARAPESRVAVGDVTDPLAIGRELDGKCGDASQVGHELALIRVVPRQARLRRPDDKDPASVGAGNRTRISHRACRRTELAQFGFTLPKEMS